MNFNSEIKVRLFFFLSSSLDFVVCLGPQLLERNQRNIRAEEKKQLIHPVLGKLNGVFCGKSLN